MKIGVKTYTDEKFLEFFENSADFFEVQAIQGKDYSFLKKFSQPIVIHSEHQLWGVDISDETKKEFNLKSINFARKIADSFGAKKIIVHPGGSISDKSIENTINFLNEINDERILIENLPEFWVGSSVENIKEILKKTKVGFCFDLNHAISYAVSSKKDILEIVKEFLKLKPTHFHIGGQKFVNKKEIDHLSLNEFDWDWKKILSLYPKNADLTLETTMDIKEVEGDVELIREIISKLPIRK